MATNHQCPSSPYVQREDKADTFYIWESDGRTGNQIWLNFCKYNRVLLWKDVPEALKKYNGSLDNEIVVFADKNAKLFFLLKYS